MIDFNKRLKNLKDRRQGTRERALVEKSLSIFDTKDYRDVEKLRIFANYEHQFLSSVNT